MSKLVEIHRKVAVACLVMEQAKAKMDEALAIIDAARAELLQLKTGNGGLLTHLVDDQDLRVVLSEPPKPPTALEVARAICKYDLEAGRCYGQNNDVMVRAERLVGLGYVVNGDPKQWSTNGVVTVFSEQQGGRVDCTPPLRQWGESDWIDHSCKASRELGDYFIEAVNGAVHMVYLRQRRGA